MDLRWGRTFESFSEDPRIAGELSAAEVRGIQRCGFPMAACVKHWVADGGTSSGTGKFDMGGIGKSVQAHGLDQGDALLDEAELRRTHIAPYLAPLAAGALSVMASYSSVNSVKCHSSGWLINELLKKELGFEGVVVSDYNAVQQVDASFDAALAKVLNAGVDIIMTAGGIFGDLCFRKQLAAMELAVETGAVPMERIDDAVRRVLRVKIKMGLMQAAEGEGRGARRLFCTPEPPLAEGEGRGARRLFCTPEPPLGDPSCVGSAEHRAVARRAVAKSCVLLKDAAGLLPLAGGELLVTGAAAHDLGYQCGGWTLEWQGFRGNGRTAGTTLWEAIRAVRPDATLVGSRAAHARKPALTSPVALVLTGEPPYAEGFGDVASLALPTADAEAAIALAEAGWSVVLVLVSGRPLVLPPRLLGKLTAVVAAWLPGTEGGGLADVLFGKLGFSGKLSFSWPRDDGQARATLRARDPLFPLGHGLDTQPHV